MISSLELHSSLEVHVEHEVRGSLSACGFTDHLATTLLDFAAQVLHHYGLLRRGGEARVVLRLREPGGVHTAGVALAVPLILAAPLLLRLLPVLGGVGQKGGVGEEHHLFHFGAKPEPQAGGMNYRRQELQKA